MIDLSTVTYLSRDVVCDRSDYEVDLGRCHLFSSDTHLSIIWGALWTHPPQICPLTPPPPRKSPHINPSTSFLCPPVLIHVGTGSTNTRGSLWPSTGQYWFYVGTEAPPLCVKEI